MKHFTYLLAIELIFLSSCSKDSESNNNGGGGSGSGSSNPYGVGKGRFGFFIATDLGVGYITVTLNNGQSTTINTYNSSATCSNLTNYFILAAGNYTFQAVSSNNVIWNGNITVVEGQCNWTQLTYSGGGSSGGSGSGSGGSGGTGGGSGTGYGYAMFWTSDITEYIDVYINGKSGKISQRFSSAPSCGTLGCSTFSLSVGTYSYTATTSSGSTWSGSITVSDGGCSKMQLLSSGSGGSGGSGGGGSTTKQLMFWSNADNGKHGTITVYVDNKVFGYVSGYYPNGTPDCGASGCANGIITDGNHTWYAKALDGAEWTGNFVVYSGCNKMLLRE